MFKAEKVDNLRRAKEDGKIHETYDNIPTEC